MKNTEVKAVYFDIDGTLIDPYTLTISESTRKAIQELQSRGVKTAVASVRPFAFIQNQEGISDISWDGYIACGGAAAYTSDGTCLYDRRIPLNVQKKIFETARRANIPVFYVVNGRKFATIMDDEMGDLMETYGMFPLRIEDWNGDMAEMIVLAGSDQKRISEIFGRIKGIDLVKAGPLNIDIFPKGINKTSSIPSLMKHWNLEDGNYAAFGDSMGDAAILEQAKLGIGMPWADSRVRNKGNVKAENHWENTISQTLTALNLI